MRYEIVQEYIQHWYDESGDNVDTYEYQTALMLETMLHNIGVLRDLVVRYRNETPLGHQPHMIADDADRVLAS